MSRSIRCRNTFAVVLGMLCLGLAILVPPAPAVESKYGFDPALSLTGDCGTSKLDPVVDPGCPYSPSPLGPIARFDEPRSIAIDAYGNEYVASFAFDGNEGRVDVFNDEGFFITELPVPKGPKSIAVDSKGNLYVFEQDKYTISRYSPSVYDPEADNIEYGHPRVVITEDLALGGGGLAVDLSTDRLYAAHGGYLAVYDTAAEGNKLLDKIEHEDISSSVWVAVDAERRRLYASSCREGIFDCGILVFDADTPHALLKEVDGSETTAGDFTSLKGWLSIAVDEETGHFFVDDLEQTDNIHEFDESYKYVSTLTFKDFQGGNALQIAVSNGEGASDEGAFNSGYLFVPVLFRAGRALAFEPPDILPPEVLDAQVVSIGETEAELQAIIDPKGGDTTYVLEYTTQQSFEEEGFASAQIAGEGTISSADSATQVSAIISGLSPGTGYHFRVSGVNEEGEGEGEVGFATYFDAPIGGPPCSNQALRIGLSTLLPDCRAYELITPPDTNGRPPKGIGFNGDQFATLQVSPLGTAVSFTFVGGALPGTEGAGGLAGDLYRATRGPIAWNTADLGPSGAEATVAQPGSTSPDQGYSFWVGSGEGSAVVEGIEGRYVRYPDGHSELIGRGSLGTDPRARGKLITENGTHIVFQTENIGAVVPQQLEPDAPPAGTRAVYDRTPDEVTHVVSLLPGDVTPAAGEHANYVGASADGNGIAFEIKDTLYLRKDNAATYEIGENVEFAGVSAGGERIFYVEGGDLLAFDTDSEEIIAFSETGDVAPVNVAPGGTRAYFVSPSVLGEENPNGAVAQAGKENLYLSEEGSISFVGTVTTRDVEGQTSVQGLQWDGLGLWTEVLVSGQLARDPSRLTFGGQVLLFQSRANLTGYDSGEFAQIYRYDKVANRLHCLSCIPTAQSATGGASLQSMAFNSGTPLPFSSYGFVPGIRADGKRAFFESDEALVSYDTDEVQDVYEWEENGVGSCEREGGCVYLISSGASERDNYLFGQGASGDDVFFTTADVLTGFDAGGTISVYDARVGGGFPEPNPAICAGEGCRPALTLSPPLPLPESGTRPQSGNVSHGSRNRGKKCPKGKRKLKRNGKVRCVKKYRKSKKHREANPKRGASK